MQKYNCDGLIPNEFIIRHMFLKMMNEKSGTVLDACCKAAKEVIQEEKELIYSYCWELESYIDLYLESCDKGKANLWKALEYAMYVYLVDDVLNSNVYVFLENYVETQLIQYGIEDTEIDSIRSYLLRFVNYNLLETDLGEIETEVTKYLRTHKVP